MIRLLTADEVAPDFNPDNWVEDGFYPVWERLLAPESGNMLMELDGSQAFFERVTDDFCEAHINVPPEDRSRSTSIAAAFLAHFYAITNFDAVQVKNRTRHVCLLVRRIGFKKVGENDGYTYLMHFRSML